MFACGIAYKTSIDDWLDALVDIDVAVVGRVVFTFLLEMMLVLALVGAR